MKKYIKNLISLFGFRIIKITKRNKYSFYDDINRNLGYEFEKEANLAIELIRKNSMLPYVNLLTLYEQCRYLENLNLEGDYVECGVWKGGAIGLMALVSLKFGRGKRKIHLFDSFEGICAPNENMDGEKAINEIKEFGGKNTYTNGELIPLIGLYKRYGGEGTLDENINLIEKVIKYPKELVSYHKGWFQDTIPKETVGIKKIAILRLDGDWYESVKIPLEHLYFKVTKGGFVIIDDYGKYEGCKKATDEFLKNNNINVYLHYSSPTCRYFIKP
ncbi:MAG: TylF/MycF/NovP-related O-methyltransferase [Candidatus Kapaibacterium sp.]